MSDVAIKTFVVLLIVGCYMLTVVMAVNGFPAGTIVLATFHMTHVITKFLDDYDKADPDEHRRDKH